MTTPRAKPPAGPRHLHGILPPVGGLILPLKSTCRGCQECADRCNATPVVATGAS